jgi:uncharacterized membrane protein
VTVGGSALESRIATILSAGTYISIALVAIGVGLMALQGIDPLAVGPRFDLGRIIGDVAALRPAGFLWLGILGVVATPATRVVASLVGYATAGERAMVLVAIAILAVIAAGVVTGVAAS